MRIPTRLRLLPFFVLALIIGVAPARAQSYLQSIGVPPFSTQLPVENGFINLANGNLHLEIPLGSFPQRTGAPEKIVLMYDSAIWSQSGGTWQPTNITSTRGFAIDAYGGWRIVTSREAGYTTNGETDSGYCAPADDYYWATYNPWIWVAPDGTQHSFDVTTQAPIYPGICGSNGSGIPNASGYANDGSGFFISITDYTGAVVYAPDGTKIGGSYATEDSNGNYAPYTTWSYTNGVYYTYYTDTLGRPILTHANDCGYYCTSPVHTLSVPNFLSGVSNYTFTLESIPVQTAFGSGDYSRPITVIQSIQLPDGSSYSFAYDSGGYGLLTSMTLPTGGTISYSYTTYPDAYGNLYRWATGRTTPDSSTPWTYGPQLLSNCLDSTYVNCQQRVKVTKPSGDDTVYTFDLNGGDWPIEVDYYQGDMYANNLLSTTVQCFSFMTISNVGGCYGYDLTQASPATHVHLLQSSTGLSFGGQNSVGATTQYSWDSNNLGELTQIQEWNFGSSVANPPDRTTQISYASPGPNILNRPANITVTAGGATVAQTLYGYDAYGLASVTGMGGHDDNYSPGYTTRGNVTSIQKLAGSASLTSYMNYDSTGQVTNSYDVNGQKTTTAYACQNGYPTTITNPLSQIITLGYDCNTGMLTSITDPNNKPSGFSYDSMLRPLSVNYPDGGQTSITYNYSGSTSTGSTTTTKVNPSQNLITTDNTDGLGRVTTSVTASDPDGNTTVTTTYDINGRVHGVSNPERSTTSSTDGTETYVYDGLDRIVQVTNADGHVSSTDYGKSVAPAGGAATQLCPAATYHAGYPVLTIDEAGKKLQSWIDGFGRTIEADEPTATSGSLTANTCYGYDGNNNLTGILAAQVNGVNQTRTYVYDTLSRLISEKNPETGGSSTPAIYNYDTDPTCAAPNSFPGDLVSRVDARGIRTCMQYDALHRMTATTYTDGTPAKYYSYDVAPSWMSDLTNVVGRLVEARNQFSGTTGAGTSTVNSYDAMGRIIRQWQQTPPIAPGGNFLYYSYDLAGDMTSYSNGAGVTITQGPFSGAGRLTQITSSLSDTNTPPHHPATLLTGVQYNALGEIASAILGNGATESFTYAPRGWPLTASVASHSTGTPGTANITVNGSEQSTMTHTAGSGYVIISGNQYASYECGPEYWDRDAQEYVEDCYWFDDSGDVWVSVNGWAVYGGYPAYDYYNNLSNWGGYAIASQLQDLINSTAGYPVTAYAQDWGDGTNATLWLTATQVGSQTNYSLAAGSDASTGSGNYCCQNGNDFSASASGAYLTGGADTLVSDYGSVSVTVGNSTTQPVAYGSGSTNVSVASQLSAAISALGFVTASNSGNVITVKSVTNGANTNYAVGASSQSSAGFSSPSFTATFSNVASCGSSTCMTGGTGAPGTLYSFSLGYGMGNSNVTSAVDSVNGSWAFTYDYLNRLSTANQNSGANACSFGYDQLGNRLSQTATAGSCGGNLTLSYAGHNNRMDGYTYDAAGNLLGDGAHTYQYDAENRLISVDGGATASYVYDAEGRRVQKKTSGTVEYLYDLDGDIVAELSSTGAWNRGEVFADGLHVATYNNGTTYFDHSDWLGTERARSSMIDANCETVINLPFGDSQGMGGSCADANPMHFTGQQWDSESNLHYFQARHYSSQFGRFMSPDPTGIFLGNLNDPQSLNLYAYVRNSPTSMTDPSGLCDDEFDDPECCDFCIPIGIGGFGGFGGGESGRIGPQPPIFYPPRVGLSPNPPNGTLGSDDPFGGETNGMSLQDWSQNFAQGDAAKQWFQKWWTVLTGLAWKPPQSRPPIRVGGPKPGNYPTNRGPHPPKEGPGPTEDGSPQVRLPDPEDIPSGEALNKLPLWRLIGYIVMREVGGIQDVFVPVVILPRNGCYPGTPCMPNGPVMQ